MNDVNMNGVNVNPKAGADQKRGFDMPLFAVPGAFDGLAEQSVARAKENCEKMKAASGEIADILRDACSTNAKSAADYAAKVIEISNANTSSALDFLTHLMGTRSLSEAIQLSATHGRKNFEATSAQNRELWELAQKVTTETAEPLKKKSHQGPASSVVIEPLAGTGWIKRLPSRRGAVQPMASGHAAGGSKS